MNFFSASMLFLSLDTRYLVLLCLKLVFYLDFDVFELMFTLIKVSDVWLYMIFFGLFRFFWLYMIVFGC